MKVLKIAAKIFDALVKLATILIALAIATYMFILPYVFHIQPFVVLSASMEPTIETGSIAFIDIADTDVEVGEIVTYRLDDGGLIETGDNKVVNATRGVVVTHRIIDYKNELYITKGDHNTVQDSRPVYQYQIVGTFRSSIPELGYILTKVTKTSMKYFIIGIIVLMNVASVMFVAVCDDDEEEDEEKKKSESDQQDAGQSPTT